MGIMKLTAGTLLVMGVLVSSAVFVTPFFISANAVSGDPKLLSTSLNRNLSAKWWQWIFSIPEKNSPITDDNPCNVKQSGPIFFLVGLFDSGSKVRDCTIPKDKGIFFPIVNVIATLDNSEDFNTLAKLKKQAAGFIDTAHDLKASVDGVDIKNIQSLRAQSPPFQIKDNKLTDEGKLTGVSDGYWVPLKPLSVGQHEIHFAGKVADLDLDVLYHITVK